MKIRLHNIKWNTTEIEVLEKLPLALKYIFEKNLTPSIIDLRYRDGAALNYGK